MVREVGIVVGVGAGLADAITESYYQLHEQPRGAWTHELDLRPWVERFQGAGP